MTTSCVDDWKFGDSFLDKAPGGDITKDTVFNNAEYTREFLWRTYAYMYYGIPYYWDGGVAVKMNTGVFEALSDCWHSHNSWDDVNRLYYSGAYVPGDRGKFGYDKERVWEGVRAAYIFLENVDQTPDMEESEKNRLKAEAKCIIASRYFDMFRHYGALPIVKESYSGTDASYEIPRATVEETVSFMVGLLDEAAPNLPWTVEEAWDGRFTKAAAEALKCKILLFAASPLFNNSTPYAGSEADEANQKHMAWYGDYSDQRWKDCLTACENFFKDLGAEGYYQLVQSTGTTSGQYRAAFRAAYSKRGNSEMLMGTRVRYNGSGWTDNAFGGHNYLFVSEWNANGGYTPTAEYMEMFDWKNGKPFNLDKALQENPDTMFVNPDKNFEQTRDPRLYETMIVNGVQMTMNDNGNYSGRRYENWVEGQDGTKGAGASESGQFATGLANNKFYFNGDRNRVHVWPYLRLAEMYLIYAEALAQNGQLDKAIENVNIVRSRVGLMGLKEADPSKNWEDKQTVIDAIMKERAVELGFEETRFFDLIRYRRSDIFQKQLHGLRMYRQKDGQDYNYACYGKKEDEPGYMPDGGFPTHYRYEKFEIQNVRRSWWNTWDNKWFLSAFPPTEINKNYGLVQNPGW